MSYTEAELLQFIEQKTDVKNYFKSYLSDLINKIRSPGCTYLTHAVKKGSFETINYFIKEKGGNVNLRETTGGTPLLIAVYLNRLEVVECLIDNGANINGVDSFGRTPLIVAVRERNLDIIEFLIDHAADFKPVDMKMFSALLWAVKMDDVQIVDLFMRKNANHLENLRLLTFAAEHGSTNIVEFLLKQEVNVDGCCEGRTPLGWASASGHLDIVKMLILNGANVDQLNTDGNTALALAAQNKRLEVVKYLTETSNVCKVGEEGKTPLFWAVQNGDIDIVTWLLDHGSDYIIDSVFIDAIALKNLNMVKLLVEKGALVNGTFSKDQEADGIKITPLMKSFDVKSVEILRYLFENGANVGVDFGKKMGTTPLLWAVQNQNFDLAKLILDLRREEPVEAVFLAAIETKNLQMVELLKEKGAVINPEEDTDMSETNASITPLMKSIQVENTEIARYLIENGANVVDDYAKATGKTPLLWAVENQDFDMVKLILDHGAENTVDSVFLQAIETKNFQIVELLKERGALVNTGNKNADDKKTPLLKALDVESIEIAKYLIENGAKVVEDLGENEMSHIVKFLENKNFQMVKLLTENGARLDALSECGNTALIKSIQIEEFEMVKYFVGHHANVNQANKDQQTPLAAAAAKNDFRILQYLVDCGAKVSSNEKDQATDQNLVRYYQVANQKSLGIKSQQLAGDSSNQEDEEVDDIPDQTQEVD